MTKPLKLILGMKKQCIQWPKDLLHLIIELKLDKYND